jgi:hypothetical protein
MGRFLDWSAWLTTSVGLALLVIGLVLVPQSGVFAEDPEIDPNLAAGKQCNSAGGCSLVCTNNSTCNTLGCNTPQAIQGGCTGCNTAIAGCADCVCRQITVAPGVTACACQI